MSLRKPCQGIPQTHSSFYPHRIRTSFCAINSQTDYTNGLDECMDRLQRRLAAYRNPSKPAHPQTGVFKKNLQSL